MQTLFPFTEHGIGEAIDAARQMRTVKSTIVPSPELLGPAGDSGSKRQSGAAWICSDGKVAAEPRR